MAKETYVSPRMSFEEVKVDEAVANTCWGYHGTSTKLFCDIPGEGYTSFQIGGGKCALNVINVEYYTKQCPDDTCNEIHTVPATDEQKKVLNDILVAAGGNEGNPFAGEGKSVIPDKPGPTFS